MVVKLDDIRLKERDPAPLYADAFREFGIDVENLDPAEAASRIGQRTIRSVLVAALDEWARRTPNDSRYDLRRQRLRDIADRADEERDALPARLRKALAQRDQKEVQSALRQLAADARANPPAPAVLVSLATALRVGGVGGEALPLLRAAVARHPGDFWLNLELATALALSGQAETDSQRYLTVAYALSNGNLGIYLYLGNAHFDLGKARFDRDAYLKAVSVYEEAIGLRRDSAEVWNNLGNARTALGKYQSAVDAFDEAIRCRPGYARAYFNRGVAFDEWEKFEEAIDSYRAAIRFKPHYADAYYNLAYDLLFEEGKFEEALSALDHGVPFLTPGDPTRNKWDELKREYQRLLDLKHRAEAALTGAPPISAAEARQLATLCWQQRALRARTVPLYEKALALDAPGTSSAVDLHRAAGFAALASGGPGQDAGQRAALRDKALNWLRAELDVRRARIARGTPEEVGKQREALRAWLKNGNLRNVKPEAVASFPEPEQEAWLRLWAEVAVLGK
jgi:tetratricopeptide (TPR) repeat protein